MGDLWAWFVLVALLLQSSIVTAGGGYKLVSVSEKEVGDHGFVGILETIDSAGDDIQQLQITVSHETNERLHLHITDLNSQRWEVPQHLVPRAKPFSSPSSSSSPQLQISYTVNPFGFTITRTSNGQVIFDSAPSPKFGPMQFKDQYLEMSTRISENSFLYGLGESTRSKGLRLFPNTTHTLWNADIAAANTDVNLYGSFPFYLNVNKEGGDAHGVLLLNSNGMDVVLQQDFLTYKVLGGIFDFYFFAGPSPLSVVQQYTQLVGMPAPIPYWALGFHQCRWGYRNVSELQEVVDNYKAADIPLEAIWTDIDHMDAFKDFTLDPVNFPQHLMHSFVKRIHLNHQRYVLIVDPGIKPDSKYATYERALKSDVFIKDATGNPYLGQVWPGPVHYPDFLHPNTSAFWHQEISRFHKILPFDGLWIDMNEASNFCSGVTCSLPPHNVTCPSPQALTKCCLICTNQPATKWDNPPYAIGNSAGGSGGFLGSKTIAPSATHYGGVLEYNAHNLYGFSEAVATHDGLRKVLKKRPFVLSRSTFVGAGRVAAHWSGDNSATWQDLKYSISSILNSGLVGIPMVGADICGFGGGGTTEELCNRWIQVGAFYPFARNHYDIQSKPHELYRWPSVVRSSRKALNLRYRLLPYFYTLLYEAHTYGSPVARPLFFSFPNDSTAMIVDEQFLIGKSLLVSPVVEGNISSVRAYLPEGRWYNLFDYSRVDSKGSYWLLDAPLESINVHVRGGSIIPMQQSANTTKLVQISPFTLLIGLDEREVTAEGELYLDDGEEIEMKLKKGKSSLVKLSAEVKKKKNERMSINISGRVKHGEYAKKKNVVVNKVVVLGGEGDGDVKVKGVMVNGVKSKVSWVVKNGAVELSGFNVCLGTPFNITLNLSA